MALFGKTKKAVEKTKSEGAVSAPQRARLAKAPAKRVVSRRDITTKNAPGRVIVRPYMTEKAAMFAEVGKYVFVVARDTTKNEVTKAVQTTFGVTVIRVNMINAPEKKVRMGRHEGHVPGFKKAMVTLKKGDKIDIGA